MMTTETPDIEQVQVRMATSNLLNDVDYPKWPSQLDRLHGLINLINSVRPDSGAFMHFLNEAISEDVVAKIAAETDAVVVGEPAEYATGQSHMAFVADRQTASQARTTFTETPSEHGDLGYMTMEVGELTLFGFHPPHMPFGQHKKERNMLFDEIFTKSASASWWGRAVFLVGDSNMAPFYPARKRFIHAGFQEAHAHDRPIYPAYEIFRGRTMRWYTPRSNLDIILAKGAGVELVGAGHTRSAATDHRTPYADYLVPATALPQAA